MIATVATILRSGGDYEPEDVRRLKACVDKNLQGAYGFVCLTDRPDDVGRIPDVDVMALEHDWPGWWAKMEVFRLEGPTLYLDLDTVVTGDLGPILTAISEKRDTLFAVRDFYKGSLQTGLLGWAVNMRWIYEAFAWAAASAVWRRSRLCWEMSILDHRFHGDADWLRLGCPRAALPVVFLQDVVSGIVSYKVHCEKQGQPPACARVVCFHGHPRPSLLHPAPPWILEAWKESA